MPICKRVISGIEAHKITKNNFETQKGGKCLRRSLILTYRCYFPRVGGQAGGGGDELLLRTAQGVRGPRGGGTAVRAGHVRAEQEGTTLAQTDIIKGKAALQLRGVDSALVCDKAMLFFSFCPKVFVKNINNGPKSDEIE